MEIKPSVDEINDIFKMAKQFIDPRNLRPTFTQIQLRIEGNTLTAYALVGWGLGMLKLPYNDAEAHDGAMLIPLLPMFKRGDIFCHITQTGKETIFTTAKGSQCCRRVDAEPVVDFRKYLPDIKKEIKVDTLCFNPKKLASALTAFGDSKMVNIDYYGNTKGIIITNGSTKAYILPVKS